MERTSHPGDTQNRCRLASCRLSAVLEVAFKSQVQGGRKPVSKEIRVLIFQMVAENLTWGAPRIHGELLKLGFDLSEPTVSRWVRRAPRPPDSARRWLIFLRNHREAIAAMDFFTVPTLTFGVLYCFFVIGHDRRRILHCNVTRNPSALWVALQLHETWECCQQPQLSRIGDRFTPGSWQSSSPSRFRDAQSGRRPRHAKRCLPRKGPPASKTRPRLVLMNHNMLNSHCQAERTVVMSAYLTEIEVVLSQELG
jgi:hypothetical protein